jgi:signal peptidase I
MSAMADVEVSSAPLGSSPRTWIAGLVWCCVLVLSVALTGCPRFTLFYGIFLALILGILVVYYLFLNAIRLKSRTRLLPAFKKFVGYAIVVQYVAYALPRAGWETDGLINDKRAVWLYILTLAGTVAGLVLYFFIRRDPAFPRSERTDKKARRKEKRGIVAVILDWADALASAVIAVLVIETFLFQLYQVPTESMVPIFLSFDRPFTLKVDAAPRLPLTEWRLPFLKQPARGDVVTIANPRYPENSGVNLKKYLSQMIYMVTFTLVNIDKTAADGSTKADPLVKRIVGVPGEKLMMVDDVLYAKTASDADFHPVTVDRQQYAQVDLWKLAPEVRARIKEIRANEQNRAELDRWDAAKNGTDGAALAAGMRSRWDGLAAAVARLPASSRDSFEKKQLPRVSAAFAALANTALGFAPAGANNPVSLKGADVEDLSLALAICRSATAFAAVKEYALSGLAPVTGPTAYERGSHAVNLIVKGNLLDRMTRDVEMVSAGATLESILADTARIELVASAQELSRYLDVFYDARNFPEFPSGSAYLGPHQYFAMGDNRYNSLDFRFTETFHSRRLDPADPTSLVYTSQLAPFALEDRYIEGYAIFRVWPLNRMGVIK